MTSVKFLTLGGETALNLGRTFPDGCLPVNERG